MASESTPRKRKLPIKDAKVSNVSKKMNGESVSDKQAADWAAARLEAAMMARLGFGGASGRKRKAHENSSEPISKAIIAKRKKVDGIEEEGEDGDGESVSDEDFEPGRGSGAGSESESENDVEVAAGSGHVLEDMRSDDDEWDGEYDDDLEEDNDSDEDTSEQEKFLSTVTATGPEVVVFQDTSAQRSAPVGSKGDWKTFMSSNISKLSGEGKPTNLTKEEADQEEQDNQHDRDLMELLKTTKLIEEYNASQLAGTDRRKYMQEKLVELGAKPAKPKAPRAIRMGMELKEKERAAKRLEEAKNMGTYHSSLKAQIMGEAGKKEKESKVKRIKERVKARSRGIDEGGGGGEAEAGVEEEEEVEEEEGIEEEEGVGEEEEEEEGEFPLSLLVVRIDGRSQDTR
ncbi:hypothetical protein SpCBS45565_g00719 [Spizellomyces sp. 'palustris']|nr:hypothetical protein SpCBS45565_g00719 [Spizellomyces sp. 'palustris']